MEQISLDWGRPRAITVSELTAQIRGLLAQSFSDVWVGGEISGLKAAASGHLYFTLKDTGAQIRCVCFKSSLRFLRFKPADGIAVLVRGRVEVYEPRGEYQMIVEALEPQGFGALQLAFEQLKKRLETEGLFSPSRKRPLSKYPVRIGIVTSRSGAVVRDIIQIMRRRSPGLHIRLYPALVQGQGSVEAVVDGIEYFSRSNWADLVIVGRGGGSIEDLWTFNEEAVARAIANSRVPVISAVGHETDFTIADFVADLRAPTPSAAAELAVPDTAGLLDRVAALRHRQERAARYRLSRARTAVTQYGIDRAHSLLERRLGRFGQRLDDLVFRAERTVRASLDLRRRRWHAANARLRRDDPRVRLADIHRRLDAVQSAMVRAIERRLAGDRARADSGAASLRQLSPLQILERGYAIVEDSAGKILRDASSVAEGAEVVARLERGRIRARVTERQP